MKTLIVPDVHQDIDWVKRILDREVNSCDRVVFLGDWMDSFDRPPRIACPSETGEYVYNLWKKLGNRAIWIVGNHDQAYFEYFLRKQKKPLALKYMCGGFSTHKGNQFCEHLTDDFIRSHKIAYFEQGYLISHAGILPNFWPARTANGDNDAALQWFLSHCDEAWKNFPYIDSPLFCAGLSRGGNSTVGGPLWCDWERDFVDELPYPQICGHTTSGNNPISRQIGKSVCLDSCQTWYGILEDKKLTFNKA